MSHTYQRPGRYFLNLEVDDDSPAINRRGVQRRELRINAPPIAAAGTPRQTCVGERVSLDAGYSRDADGTLIEYQWDLGDGTQTAGAQVEHRYAEPGTYDARLRVRDDSGTQCDTAEDTTRITVNAPPVADAGGDREAFSGGAHDAVFFNAEASSDPDENNRLSYAWFFGDRTPIPGKTVYHAFPQPGTYQVKLRVRDDSATQCNESWGEVKVVVEPHPRQ